MAKNSLQPGILGVMASAALLFYGCDNASEVPAGVADSSLQLLPAQPAASPVCGPGGRFETELFGALAGPIAWSGDELSCEGMPRPEGRGARLRFAGSTAGIDLVFLLSLPGIEPGRLASELPSNVTLIEEGDARFFSTSDLDSCWTDVASNEPVDERAARYRLAGTLYCIAPLAEVNGDASVTIEEVAFSGYVDWSPE